MRPQFKLFGELFTHADNDNFHEFLKYHENIPNQPAELSFGIYRVQSLSLRNSNISHNDLLKFLIKAVNIETIEIDDSPCIADIDIDKLPVLTTVKKLRIDNSKISSKQLAVLLKKLPNLEILQLNNCTDLAEITFEDLNLPRILAIYTDGSNIAHTIKLKLIEQDKTNKYEAYRTHNLQASDFDSSQINHAEILHIEDITCQASDFASLLRRSPNLESISFGNNGKIIGTADLPELISLEEIHVTWDNNHVAIDSQLIVELLKKSPNLESLAGFIIKVLTLAQINDLPLLTKLEEFSVLSATPFKIATDSYAEDIDTEKFIAFAHKISNISSSFFDTIIQRYLQEMSLEDIKRLPKFLKVESLSLGSWSILSAATLETINHTPNLEKLKIDDFRDISNYHPNEVIDISNINPLPKLTELEITPKYPQLIDKLISQTSILRKLTIRNARDLSVLTKLHDKLANLEELDISYSHEIDEATRAKNDAIIGDLLIKCRKMKSIDISKIDFSKITPLSFAQGRENLESLYISPGHTLNAEQLAELIKNLPNLKHLHVDLRAIPSNFKLDKLAKLETLEISYIPIANEFWRERVSDDKLTHVLQLFPYIKHLTFKEMYCKLQDSEQFLANLPTFSHLESISFQNDGPPSAVAAILRKSPKIIDHQGKLLSTSAIDLDELLVGYSRSDTNGAIFDDHTFVYVAYLYLKNTPARLLNAQVAEYIAHSTLTKTTRTRLLDMLPDNLRHYGYSLVYRDNTIDSNTTRTQILARESLGLNEQLSKDQLLKEFNTNKPWSKERALYAYLLIDKYQDLLSQKQFKKIFKAIPENLQPKFKDLLNPENIKVLNGETVRESVTTRSKPILPAPAGKKLLSFLPDAPWTQTLSDEFVKAAHSKKKPNKPNT